MCSHTTARHGNAIQPTTTCASDCDQRSKPRFTEAWPHVVCRIQSEGNQLICRFMNAEIPGQVRQTVAKT